MKRLFSAIVASSLLVGSSPVVAGGRTVACYEPIEEPAVYETVAEQVIVRPGRRYVETIPAQYGYRERTVEVEPQSVEYRILPAQYHTAEETVLIRPQQVLLHSTPPVYETVTEEVLLAPAREAWVWKVIDGRRVLCKVVASAQYGHRARRIMVDPGQTIQEVVPAQYGTRQRTVQIAPERRQPIVRPARYATVQERVIISPAHEVVRTEAPEYGIRHRQVKVREAERGWSQVHLRGSGC